jgi:hypothetical protein
MVKAYSPLNIQYRKDSGETSTRTIIPTTSVPQNIRAVDISSLDEGGKTHITNLFAEYNEYVDLCISKMFSFQDWVEHTSGEHIEPVWRTFKRDNVTILDERQG